MEVNVERFREAIKPFLNDWKSFDLRLVASQLNDVWVFGGIRIVLDSSPPSQPDTTQLPSVNGLIVLHESRDIEQLDALLKELSSGELHVGSKLVMVKHSNQNPQISYSFMRSTAQESRQRIGVDSCSFYLQSWAGQQMIEGDREKVESGLRSAEPPWDGVDDLVRNFLHASSSYAGSMPTKIVEVIAPIAAFFTKAAFTDDYHISASIEMAPSLDLGELKLSAIGSFSDKTQTRLTVRDKASQDPSHVIFEATFPRTPLLATLILSYRGLDVDKIQLLGRAVSGLNPRLVLLQEEGIADFLTALKDDDDKYFEDRVAILFHLLGLSPGHYGRTDKNNVDILVFSPSEDWIFAVECTSREIDLHDKVSKLATRKKILAANLPNVTVHPVLVTKLPSGLVNETEKEKATREGISLITSDDFENLIQIAIGRVDTGRVRDYILGRVPRQLMRFRD